MIKDQSNALHHYITLSLDRNFYNTTRAMQQCSILRTQIMHPLYKLLRFLITPIYSLCATISTTKVYITHITIIN